MSKIDPRIRLLIEDRLDQVLLEPEGHEKAFRTILYALGIEPNLESILAMVGGIILGETYTCFNSILNREPNEKEILDIIQLLKRRAWELRETFINIIME